MAEQRGARIYGEIVGHGSSTVVDRNGASHCDQAVVNAVRMAFRNSGTKAAQIGHVHAHGLSTRRSDRDEATAIQNTFAEREEPVPVVAAKSHFGNLGAGSGAVELIASLKAMQHGELFPVLNYETPDAECPLAVVRPGQHVAAGESVLNINFTPQGQASALVVKREAEL
jgi:3-oxoacyl-[acyl-carrier-protein] synthase II